MRLVLISACVCVFCAQGSAGPKLDELVTPMRLDQRSGDANLRSHTVSVAPGKPVGQTFVTGTDASRLCRVAIGAIWWNGSWGEDELLVLTIYGSPTKQDRIGAYAMPHKWRRWEGCIAMFPIWQKIEPNRSYYLELTVSGGDESIDGICTSTGQYDQGEGFLSGRRQAWDLFFETHVKGVPNPDADYGRLFSLWNLDYEGLEKVRGFVEKRQWEPASYALVEYYEENRPDLLERVNIPETRPADFDTREAELAMRMQTTADGDEGVVDIGPDWNHYAIWPTRGGVGLTRGGIRKFIATAYRYTGDRKYARLWNDVNYCCLRDQPNPVEAGAYPRTGPLHPAPPAGIFGGTMWSSLSIGPRAGFGFAYYRLFVDCPEFEPDVRAAFIFNVADMADVLMRHQAGGNWTTQIKSTLLVLGEEHPEWAKSRQMLQGGFDGMVQNLLETVHPDGPLKEATFNYHLLTLNRFTRMLTMADRLKLKVPNEARERVVKAAEYATFAAMPDFTAPLWGDSNPVTNLADGGVLLNAAKLFGRDDMLWIASGGKEGSAPVVGSIAFPHAGYFVMRSGWQADARYLAIHNGHSTSHGHFDALSLIVAAHGRQLIVDPGVFIYGTEHSARLTRTTSHSTVAVDDRNTVNADGENAWASNAAWDYFDGTNAGYQGMNEVKHRREILFVKPDYWVIRDSITGAAGRAVKSRFVVADTQVQLDKGIAATSHADGGNLMIMCVEGRMKLVSMQRAASWDKLTECTVVEHAPPSSQWYTVLVPYGDGKRPDVKVEPIADGLRVICGQRADVVRFGSKPEVERR